MSGTLFRLLQLTLIAVTASAVLCSNAYAIDNELTNTTRLMQQNTKNLVNQLQTFLQSNGRWTPKPGSKDMQCCNTMHEIEKQVKSINGRSTFTKRQNLSNDSFQLQAKLQRLGSQLQQIGANGSVMGRFQILSGNVRQFGTLTQPSFNTPLVPGAIGQGSQWQGQNINNNSTTNNQQLKNAISRAANKLNKDVNLLSNSLKEFLQSKGRWKPQVVGNDLKCANSLHELLKQSNKLKGQAFFINQTNLVNAVTLMQHQLVGLKAQLRSIGANQIVMNNWQTVAADVVQLTSIASGGSINFNSNPVLGQQPGGGLLGLQFISSTLVSPNLFRVTWQGPQGRQTFVSRKGTFILSDGVNSRAAVGEEIRMLRQAYSAGI